MTTAHGVMTHTVAASEAGRTIGQLLLHEMAASRTLIKRMKAHSLITLNGLWSRTNAIVAPGDVIRVDLARLAACRESGVEPEPMPLAVLYEDDSVLVTDKPAGVIVHPSWTDGGGTLANAVANHYLSTCQTARVHPVSRLDRDTTGIVLFAKDPYAGNALHRASRQGEIGKEYLAIVWGAPSPGFGLIDVPIGRDARSIVLREPSASGKTARTLYSTVWQGGGASLVRLALLTGRTHQIRVHMSAIGCPIVADGLYGRGDADAGLIGRQALHAWRLRFPHPADGSAVRVVSELPQDFTGALAALGAPPWEARKQTMTEAI